MATPTRYECLACGCLEAEFFLCPECERIMVEKEKARLARPPVKRQRKGFVLREL